MLDWLRLVPNGLIAVSAGYRTLFCAGAVAFALAASTLPSESLAQAGGQDATPVKDRNIGAARAGATRLPRSEGDQAIVNGWPLYRTERGQTAFNDAMAALTATEGAAPPAQAFKGCIGLECNLSLPALSADGWMPAGRIWVSPAEYVLIAHSPRSRSYRLRGARGMKYFVFHEFHNGSRNTDVFDTISSHARAVFVPLYMSKPMTDAKGRRFVVVMQVAPHDVVSIHASNKGSAGPGIEVAKNHAEVTEPLQELAGILVATMIKNAAPQLQIVNHQGVEGLSMLGAYERRLSAVRAGAPAVALPFVPALAPRVASASGSFDDMILRPGMSPRIPVAERGIVPPRAAVAAVPATSAVMSPLAENLRVNLETMKRHPDFAGIIPADVAAIAEEAREAGVVYLLDANRRVLGRIEPHRENGTVVNGKFVYVPAERADAKPKFVRTAALAPARTVALRPTLDEPVTPKR